MRHPFRYLCLVALLALGLCGALRAQEDIRDLSDPAFGGWRKAPVPFMHDQHNAKAKLTDCKTCHHLYANGKLDPAGDSVGSKCSECHAPQGGGKAIPLMRAYHRQCENCHAATGAGPVTCGECHPKTSGRK